MSKRLFKMLSRKSAGSNGSIGIWIQNDGVAMARVVRQGGTPRLTACEFRPVPIGAEPAFVLRALISSLVPEAGTCNYVLAPDEYQTLLVDTPDVSPSEMREAVRWKIHDLIDMPLSDATVDVFDIPVQINHGEEKPRSLCVVVSQNSVIEQKVALLTRCGFKLAAIDIAEMALRNFASLLPQDREGQLILHIEEDYSLVVITKASTIYLSRRIAIGAQSLNAAQVKNDDGEEKARLLEMMGEEIYRSLEYCESRFQGMAPSSIGLTPAAMRIPGLSSGIADGSALPVHTLELESLLPGTGKIPLERQAACLMAAGAALRQEQTTL